MSSFRWETHPRAIGGRNQSGIPERRGRSFDRVQGLMLRGVVVATYIVDDDNHPEKAYDENTDPVAVYCDVLTYSSMMNQQTVYLRACLVSQDIGGMHRGRVWKPRAAQIDKTGDEIDLNSSTNVANLDGDHVLVGFVDGNPNTPIILRGVPHPSADEGNGDRPTGNRLRLVDGDGDPDLFKHHGTFYGVGDNGDFLIDTRYANDGELDEQAQEAAPPTDGKGSVRMELPQDAEHAITLYDMANSPEEDPKVTASRVFKKDAYCIDMPTDGSFKVTLNDISDPDNPDPKMTLVFDMEKLEVTFVDSGLKLEMVDADDKVEVTTAGGLTTLIDGSADRTKVTTGGGLELLVDGSADLVELGAEGGGEVAVLDSKVQTELARIKDDLLLLMDEIPKHRHPLPEFPFPLMFADIMETFAQPLIYIPMQAPTNIRTGANANPGSAPMDIDAQQGEIVGPPPVNPDLRESGLFTAPTDPGDTSSDTVTIRS